MRFVVLILTMFLIVGAAACKSTFDGNVESKSLERNKDSEGGGY